MGLRLDEQDKKSPKTQVKRWRDNGKLVNRGGSVPQPETIFVTVPQPKLS